MLNTSRRIRFMLAASVLLAGAAISYGQNSEGGLEGTWQGTLDAGAAKLRLVLNITKASDGAYLGTLTSIDQGGVKIPIDRIQLNGNSVHLELKAVNGTYDGSIIDDKKQLKGTWTQGGPTLPLEFTRPAGTADIPKASSDTATAQPPSPPSNPFGIPLELTVPISPSPFPAGGKTNLVYELHITNFAAIELLLRRVEVVSGATTLATFEGTELNTMLMRPGTANLPDNRTIAAGMRAIAYIWITLDAGTPIPTSLQHRVSGTNQSVVGGAVDVAPVKPIVLGPPLRGSDWIALNGPSNGSIHRRALIPLNGKVQIAQRFAIDWSQINAAGRMFSGDGKDNKQYRAYGNEILSVADGVVAAAMDGIPENVPGLTSRAVPITPETIGGNNVILDLGQGRFAFYAHMQPGSVRVKKGDRVRRGQVLGLVGNSGNATGPHLHFHISNSSTGLESEGLPYVFESFEVQTAPGKWEPRRNELPLQNARVRFADAN